MNALKKRVFDCLWRSPSSPKTFESETQWVLTVPAIWTDQARLFMREAMAATGLMSSSSFDSKIQICLEPEGAALHCFHEIKEWKVMENQRFLVVDVGGGTADITSHRVLSYSPETKKVTFEEISPPSGGHWGGRLVDGAFYEKILRPVLGEEVYAKFMSGLLWSALIDCFEFV